jgi:hypothetical protein
MKLIYIGACCAYISEIIKQTPVLTGASRTAMLWRLNELIAKAQQLDATLTTRFGIDKSNTNISLTPTLHKIPHQYPSVGSTPFRDSWRTLVLESGQSIDDWISEEYVPMLINVGIGNAVSGKYTFHFGIKLGSEKVRHEPFGISQNKTGGWYMDYYDEGSINDHTDKFDIWGDYNIGPWELHKDGQLAFNREFNRLFNLSGVAGLRNVLSGMPVGTGEAYLGQITEEVLF